MDANQFLNGLRKLDPEAIRQRLANLAAEEKTLRLMLQAAARAQKVKPPAATKSKRSMP